MEFELMGANNLLTPVFNENRWVQIDLSQNRWVQLHPLTHPNKAPVTDRQVTRDVRDRNMIMTYAFGNSFFIILYIWHAIISG